MLIAWVVGLLAGAWGGLGSLIGGVVGLLAAALLVAALLVRSARRPWLQGASLAGAGVGFGATWLALLARAEAACEPESCSGSDSLPWLVVGAVLLAAGGLATALIVFREARRGPV